MQLSLPGLTGLIHIVVISRNIFGRCANLDEIHRGVSILPGIKHGKGIRQQHLGVLPPLHDDQAARRQHIPGKEPGQRFAIGLHHAIGRIEKDQVEQAALQRFDGAAVVGAKDPGPVFEIVLQDVAGIPLDPDLARGAWRELTSVEIKILEANGEQDVQL